MSEITPNLSSNVIHNIKEEMLFDLRQLENKLMDQINKKWIQIESTNNSLLDRIAIMMDNNKQMIDSITLQKINLDKIADYEPFKNKIEAMVTSHEIRINSISTDVINFRAKYDKIISDNLTVPGFIGPSCQFKSISDFLYNQILEASKAKNEKEQIKSDVKDCKIRVDGFVKSMVNLNDNSVIRCNQYTDHKEKNIKEYIQNIIDNFEKKNLDMRAGIYDKQEKMFEKIKNDMKQFDELLVLKNDINDALEIKFKEYENKFNNISEKIDVKGKEIINLEKDIKKNHKSINDLNSTIKEVLFKQTSNQMDITKINAKLKRGNYNMYKRDINNNNNQNNTDNLKTSNNGINDGNLSPMKNNKVPNIGINMFKESISKGKTLINRKKNEIFKDDLFRIQRKYSQKIPIFEYEDENSENENDNKLYEQINYKKLVASNEISYSITNNNNINTNNNNNDVSNNSVKNKILKNNNIITENKIISFKRSSKSEYKYKKSNLKYVNLLKNNNDQNNTNNLPLKISKIDLHPEEIKRYKTLNSDDGFKTSSAKISKGINIKNLLSQKNDYNYDKKVNFKLISLGDKISLDSDSKDIYNLDFESLKKRSLRFNLISPLSNTLKTYQNERNKHNSNKELNIKVSPAFGSTAYSFYQKKDFNNNKQ